MIQEADLSSVQKIIDALRVKAEDLTHELCFDPIDADLYRQIKWELQDEMIRIRNSGTDFDEFLVTCDDSVNTEKEVSRGTVKAVIKVIFRRSDQPVAIVIWMGADPATFPAIAEQPSMPAYPTPPGTLRQDIERAINRHSAESGSNTPDFILADFLVDCLAAFDKASRAREKWYGKALSIGGGVTDLNHDYADLLGSDLDPLPGPHEQNETGHLENS